VKGCVEAMNAAGIITSLFIDPDEPQIELSARWARRGLSCIPAPTPRLPHAAPRGGVQAPLCRRLARQKGGLTINAGHGINYVNIARSAPSRTCTSSTSATASSAGALFTGIDEAVREMKRRMNSE